MQFILLLLLSFDLQLLWNGSLHAHHATFHQLLLLILFKVQNELTDHTDILKTDNKKWHTSKQMLNVGNIGSTPPQNSLKHAQPSLVNDCTNSVYFTKDPRNFK